MPVSTRAQQANAAGGQPWSSAAPASAPGHDGGARREILTNHHHGLKEKMRALTLFYEQHKQQLASSQGAGARSRRSIQYAAGEMGRDQNGKNAEEDVGGKRHNAVVAAVSEAAVLRENMAS
ncbi:hypothetical protein E2562_020286 [Oryza meyeriana var. granulata]|uniref:Uncharacterized protein n=1 Tax=Oryza meyeriana var. granulata TaxID=110450 RepID=A0A6G1DL12_9ORYZ|nr:hypothetical protein E2562_020286 [Oryza meyeriana var. granulata]